MMLVTGPKLECTELNKVRSAIKRNRQTAEINAYVSRAVVLERYTDVCGLAMPVDTACGLSQFTIHAVRAALRLCGLADEHGRLLRCSAIAPELPPWTITPEFCTRTPYYNVAPSTDPHAFVRNGFTMRKLTAYCWGALGSKFSGTAEVPRDIAEARAMVESLARINGCGEVLTPDLLHRAFNHSMDADPEHPLRCPPVVADNVAVALARTHALHTTTGRILDAAAFSDLLRYASTRLNITIKSSTATAVLDQAATQHNQWRQAQNN
jgi:hypothetical protein